MAKRWTMTSANIALSGQADAWKPEVPRRGFVTAPKKDVILALTYSGFQSEVITYCLKSLWFRQPQVNISKHPSSEVFFPLKRSCLWDLKNLRLCTKHVAVTTMTFTLIFIKRNGVCKTGKRIISDVADHKRQNRSKHEVGLF